MFRTKRYRAPLWLALCLVVLLAIACGSGSSNDSTATTAPSTGDSTAAPTDIPTVNLKVQLNFILNAEHYGVAYADKTGIYKENHLNVDVIPGGQGIDGLQLVAGGAADIAVSTPANVMTAISQGIPVIAFAAEFHKTPQAMICRKDSGVTDISDLAGKTFGVKNANGEETTRLFLQKNGIDLDTIKTSPIGASSVTEIIAGIVDCQAGFAVNEPNSMRKAGVEPVVFLYNDYGWPSQGNVYITTPEVLAKKKDALARWVKATALGWQQFLMDPEAAANWILDNHLVDGLDLDQQIAQATAEAPLIADEFTMENGLLALDPDSWQAVAQQVVEEGRVENAVDLSAVMTSEVVDLAYADGKVTQ
jgi:NitT/TauT family transport system substrate-binding protein